MTVPATAEAGAARKRHPVVGCYAMAVGAVALGWLLRLGLTAWVGEGLPLFITFYPAVMLVALLCGRGPGLLASGLVVLSVAWRLPPAGSVAVAAPMDMVSLALFAGMAVLLVAVTHRYRLDRRKAAAYDAEAASRQARLAAEQALRQSEERYRLLVDQAVDGIFMADATGRLLDVNAAYAQMLGISREGILARNIADMICAEERDRLPQVVAQLADGAVGISAWRFRRLDGSTFLGEVVGRQLPDGRLLGILRDVSAGRRLEAERQQERALLNSVMAGTDIQLVYLDFNFNFLWVNQAYARSCRMTPAEMIGKNHFVLYPDAGNEATFRQVRDTGEPVFHKDKAFEFPDQPERGITYWDWSLVADRDALGEVIGLVFSLRETTEHVRVQLAVRESEGRFAALADAAPVLIWMCGPDHQCSWVNQQWLSFTGRSLEQEIGGGWLENVHPDDIEQLLATSERDFAQRVPCRVEYRLRSANGEYRWLADQSAAHYAPDGRYLGYIGTCVDITERRRGEDALVAAQTFANATLDAISKHLCVLDPTGQILAVNQAWRDFFDDNAGGASGHHNYFIGANYLEVCDAAAAPCPADTVSMADGIRQVIGGQRRDFTFEYSCHSPDRDRWFIAKVTRFRGGSGNVLVTHEDVSERKRAEEAVQAARAEAEQANLAKSRFLAAASHDLRQPLSALSIYVDVLKATGQNAPLLANMANCVASLSELLTDLLDLSKLDAGVVQPEVRDFSVAELLAGLAAVHGPDALQKGLSFRVMPSRLAARTDPVLFRRILGNLIANAIRYTEQGGVLIGCRRRQGKRWIEIWDSGIGIPADKFDEIFEEFRQLDHEERNRGSGLGLAIAARSAALLGLEIRVASRLGHGSMFALELPLGEANAAPPATAPVFRPLHVALVDDNVLVLDAVACALTGIGHRVSAAPSGLELFERLGDETPDLVISDFRLAGGLTGFDVIEDARALFGDDLPALLITGDTDPALLRSMTERGVMLLHKPLQMPALEACIARVIDAPKA